MVTSFDDVQKLSKESLERAVASFGAVQKGFQALAAEMTEASQKAFAANTAYVERLVAARTLDRAVEVQSDYARTAYEALVAEAGKVNGLLVDMAKGAVKPYEVVKTV